MFSIDESTLAVCNQFEGIQLYEVTENSDSMTFLQSIKVPTGTGSARNYKDALYDKVFLILNLGPSFAFRYGLLRRDLCLLPVEEFKAGCGTQMECRNIIQFHLHSQL